MVEHNPVCPNCEGALTIEQTDFFESRICESCLDYCELIDLKQCCSNPKFEVRKLIISGGGIQVRNQCINCGFVDPKSIGGFNQLQRERALVSPAFTLPQLSPGNNRSTKNWCY